ncbi:MAG: hypothetical protein OHK0040_08210 [bacterium]
MNLFKCLANDTRLRIIHAVIMSEEICVTELANQVGMKPQAVSNQLQRLADKGIVTATRSKNKIKYKVVDPCVQRLLEFGLCVLGEDGNEDNEQR